MEFNNVVSIIACIYQRKARNKKWSSHKAKEKQLSIISKLENTFIPLEGMGPLLKKENSETMK